MLTTTDAMLATTGPVAGCIPPFAWATDEGQRTYRLGRFAESMRAAIEQRRFDAFVADFYARRTQSD